MIDLEVIIVWLIDLLITVTGLVLSSTQLPIEKGFSGSVSIYRPALTRSTEMTIVHPTKRSKAEYSCISDQSTYQEVEFLVAGWGLK